MDNFNQRGEAVNQNSPASSLTSAEQQQYARTIQLIGEAAFVRLRRSAVAICGLGGVGGGALEALVRAGIGRLVLIDGDTVAVSNLNRQLIATQKNLGQPKAQAAALLVEDIDPQCCVTVYNLYLNEANVAELLADVDYVIDAIDSVNDKVALIAYCVTAGIGLVSSMGTGNKLHAELLQIADISRTEVCPLARVMRRRLKEIGITRGVDVLYSRELPSGAKQESGERRAPGSISFVPPVAGMLLAGHCIRRIIEVE